MGGGDILPIFHYQNLLDFWKHNHTQGDTKTILFGGQWAFSSIDFLIETKLSKYK